MNDNQFLYFITVPGNENLLKTEINLFYPDFKFSFSRTGIVTFKNIAQKLTLQQISNLEIIFALTWGETISLEKRGNLKQEYIDHLQSKYPNSNFTHHQLPHLDYMDEWQLTFNQNLKKSLSEIDVIRYHRDDILIGQRLCDRWNSPWRRQFTINKEDTISRAYYKGSDAFSMFLPNIGPSKILELGSSPGGTSLYLLEAGHLVTGIDPAEMHPKVDNHQHFTHLKIPIQSYEVTKPNNFNIITSDMNLSPKMALREVSRIFPKLPNIKDIFITLKLTSDTMIMDIPNYKKYVLSLGFKTVFIVQLPHHKKECLLFAKR